MKIKVIVGDNIRGLRYKLNISQEKLAEYAGLHRNYIGFVERAEVNMTLENIAKIAKALQVHPNELLVKDFFIHFDYPPKISVKKRWERS